MANSANLHQRLYASCLIILLLGFASAILIYVTAQDDPDAAMVREMVASKRYQRELQRFGGKAAVLFDEFNRWFGGLWQGKSLGVTVAWISVLASGGVYLVARRVEINSKGNDSGARP